MGKLFQELRDLKDAYDKKLSEAGEEAVKDAFKDVFDKFPEISEIAWCQYTPYFNDGDPCYFSVHDFDVRLGSSEDMDAKIKAKRAEAKSAEEAGNQELAESLEAEAEDLQEQADELEDSYGYGESLYVLGRSNDPRVKEVVAAVKSLANELPSDVLEVVFGDHVRITATRKGFSITEKDHD
jgi:hypothetical protein